jgi:MFS family permease
MTPGDVSDWVRFGVCFSPQADLVGGTVVAGIGIDACWHLRGRREHLLLAALPVVLGVHQLVEAFVWWGLQGHVSHTIERVALWLYLLIAFVLLPTFVPLAVRALEITNRAKRRMLPFVVLGAIVSVVLLAAMLRAPGISVELRPYHLAYGINLNHGGLIVSCYVTAVCGALFFSGYRDIALFGLANLVAVVVIAWLTIDGFASIWCGYAALSAGAIALHMRYTKPHRASTPLLA